MAELADAADLKSAAFKRGVGVRVPLSAPSLQHSEPDRHRRAGEESLKPTAGKLQEATSTCSRFPVYSGVSVFEAGRALTILEIGALSDLDNITVRIADVAARLAVLGDRLRDELRSSTFP